jgi:hypothetical protein
MTWQRDHRSRRWPGPAGLVEILVRRIFGPTDRPASGYEYARMSEAGYHSTMAPRPQDAPAEVISIAKELTQADAVDEGNGHLLDAIVRAWGGQWCDEELRQHNARASILQMHALNAQAWHDRCDDHVAQLEEELRRTEIQLTNLGTPTPAPPRSRTPTEDEA